MAKSAYIYCLIDPLTLEVKYIGKTVNTHIRLFYHLSPSSLKANTKKNNWIKSLKTKGLKPLIEVIDQIEENDWQFWEMHYISLYKSWGFNLKNGTAGGEGGSTTKGKPKSFGHRQKIKIALSGKSKSKQHKENISLSRRGKSYEVLFGEKASEQKNKRTIGLKRVAVSKIKKVYQYTLNNILIKEWSSAPIAEKQFNNKVKVDNIGACARGRQKTAYNYIWKY